MIRKASTDEYDKVLSFYYKLIDDMKEKPYHPKWQKDIYPNSDDILRGLQSAELFVYEADGQKAVRLDVLVGNIPAKRLYESCGFEYRDKVTLFYEDTGVTDFEIYEFVF